MNGMQLLAAGWIAGIATAIVIEWYVVPWGQRRWGGAPITDRKAWNDGFESGVKFAGGTVLDDAPGGRQ